VPPWSGAVILGRLCAPRSRSVVGRWQLRSANSGTLVVPRTRTTIGRRDFAVAGPATWNFITVQRYICEKNSKLIYLAASALEVFCNWALYKLTYSFIHSFIHYLIFICCFIEGYKLSLIVYLLLVTISSTAPFLRVLAQLERGSASLVG